jgi:DNA-directed RNA polymerase subunit RPC12/RpoP
MEQWYKCPQCNSDILYGTNPCPSCKSPLAWDQHKPVYEPLSDSNLVIVEQSPQYFSTSTKKVKIVKETKCTCNTCGNIWYFGKQDTLESFSNAMGNAGKSMMCLGGCLPAIFIPDKKVINLDKCPQCGSRAISKEIVTHEVL